MMDASRNRIAVSVMPLETRRAVLITAARTADRLGYDAFFLPETWAYDITVLLAEVALKTDRIGIGPGILGVWTAAHHHRHGRGDPAELSHGRFALGLGASTPQLTEGLHDVVYTRPLARMRQTITQVRALLHGERVPLVVAKEARALKLNLPSAAGITISLAALGDDAIRLAGELGSWLPFLYPGRGSPRDGPAAEGAGRGSHPDQVPEIHPRYRWWWPGRAAREGGWFVAFYLVNMGTMIATRWSATGSAGR
jgi:alkanesulfonate monooxygenase SsuD/methylene tetrahydromethanopterin reductase-like flavin-dependent oxidoreductase (luciferase family)